MRRCRQTIDLHTGRVTELYVNAAYCRLAGGATVAAYLAQAAARALPQHVTHADHLCRLNCNFPSQWFLISLNIPESVTHISFIILPSSQWVLISRVPLIKSFGPESNREMLSRPHTKFLLGRGCDPIPLLNE
jgi:hypothetical protein